MKKQTLEVSKAKTVDRLNRFEEKQKIEKFLPPDGV